MRKEALLIFGVVVLAVGVRIYPVLVSGMPFSVDAWPLIRNAEELVQNTPVALNSGLFDGYNSYMPGVQLYGSVLSKITGASPLVAMAYGVPLAAALAIPIFYALTKKVVANQTAALVASLLLATVFPYALFMAGVTKESYASPLLFSVLLIFLLKHDLKTTFLFSLAAVALTLTHHLTVFLAAGIIASLTIAAYISKPKLQKTNSVKSNILYGAVLLGAAALYFGCYASPALISSFNTSDLISLGAYAVALTALTIYFVYTSKGFSTKKTVTYGVLWATLGCVVIFLITQLPLVPGAPTLPTYYFLFALPTLICLPLALAAFKELNHRSPTFLLPLFWVVALASFGFFAVFANTAGGFGLLYRCVNFLLTPFLILVALGLSGVVGSVHTRRRLVGVVAVFLVACLAVLNFGGVYASVSLSEPYFGYFWRYEPSEFQAAQYVASASVNQTVGGDAKVSYLLGGYFNRSVDVLAGYRYLEGEGSAPALLYVYRQMYRNGYVLYQSIPETLPENWTSQLEGFNQVYSNSEVTLYAKP